MVRGGGVGKKGEEGEALLLWKTKNCKVSRVDEERESRRDAKPCRIVEKSVGRGESGR